MQGSIVVVGGLDSDNKDLKSCEQFNVQLSQWSSIASLNKPRYNAAAAAHSHSVFVFGGFIFNEGYLDEIEQYDTAADKWTVLQARLSVARERIAAACLDDNVYLFGGLNENKLIEASSTTECFSVKNNRIETTDPLHKPTYNAVAVGVVQTTTNKVSSDFLCSYSFTTISSCRHLKCDIKIVVSCET